MKQLSIILILVALSGAGVASYFYEPGHDHIAANELILGHSGRTDSSGGHNCSEKSKLKRLCTGYHYHKRH